MTGYPVDVTASGAVLLGPTISCDGFHYAHDVRVQTHVHTDHMHEFETSKGNQEIFLSPPTRELLIGEFNADLPFRQNLRVLAAGDTTELDGNRVRLVSSGHMLGAVQVEVEMPDGTRVGYSGDFAWPLEEPIQVDALVVDSTYGSPASLRQYSQDEAEYRLLALIESRVRVGPVHVFANRGTLQRALQILAGNVVCPLVGSKRLQREAEIYRRHGYAIDELRYDCEEAVYIRFYGRGDKKPVDPVGTTISLSAFMASPLDPVLEYSERAFRVALSNHADFEGTLEYVRATGAREVVTDNTRGHGIELAQALRSHLGVEARPSLGEPSPFWGQ